LLLAAVLAQLEQLENYQAAAGEDQDLPPVCISAILFAS